MMNTPTVSILMGSYNPKDLQILRAAVGSVITQTWTDWELLICDDGSDEPYAGYLRALAGLDPRIRCIRSEKNMGLAHALNLCLRHARGCWIARMDDDDISEPHRLEQQVRFLREHTQYAWVGTQALLFHRDTVWGTGVRPECPAAADYLNYSPFIHPSVMFRRSVLEQAGGYRESALTARCEDYELFMRLAAAGYRGYNLQDPLLRYREDPDQLRKRTFRSCLFEAIIRFRGFRDLGLLRARNFPYVVKPLAVYLLSRAPRMAQRIRRARSSGIQSSHDHVKRG